MKLAKLAGLSRPTSTAAESLAEGDQSGTAVLALDEPVFILACPRSGSTLLRLLLDAHPRLACPPETNIAQWCVELWSTWALLDPDCSQEKLTEEAVQHIHSMVNAPFTAYLRQRGKSRWCDKSLGTARYADQITQIYKKAKFICLHRHVMDMISSGLEATPWGLNGYGFDRYKGSPNTVSALAESWIESTALSLRFEEANPDLCMRVRYEELVADPEGVMDSVFDFLGVRAVPGIAQSALAVRSIEKYEIGDHKIRTSSKITTASVGRGIRVPSHLLPVGQREVMNHLLGRLDYAKVDRSWRMSMVPPELMVRSRREMAKPAKDSRGDAFTTIGAELNRRISRQIMSLSAASSGWTRAAITAYAVATPIMASVWIVDRLSGQVSQELGSISLEDTGADWAITADIDTWQAVLTGKQNMAQAIRQGNVRFIGRVSEGAGDDGEHTDPSMQISDSRLQAITHLLSLASSLD